ncbi:MAG: endonuclease/exonuclease/phosphatase family protein [Aeromicrobium sp.]
MAALGGGLASTYAGQQDELDAPTAVSAKPVSPTSVEFDWKGSKDVDSYVIRVGEDRALTSAVSTTVPATETGAGTSKTIADLSASTPGVDRFYRIDAVRDDEVRSSRTGRFALMPADIKGFTISGVTAGGVKARWDATANARQFDVTMARDKGFTEKATTVRTVAGDTSFVLKGLTSATKYWIKVRPVNGDQVGSFTEPLAFRTRVRESSFKVATWNVCSEKCDDYESRASVMANFLDDNEVDMFGLQESGGIRVGAVTNRIFSGHSREFVRAEGGAKARYIFYRPALFEQLDGGSFDIGDGRDTTWGKFRVLTTKRTFYYVDVHLDNGKGKDADSRRSGEMDRMLGTMAAINDDDTPMIYAGDYNSGSHRDQDTPGVKMRGAGLGDSVLLTKDVENAEINTGHTFSTEVLDSGALIDHIWVTPEFEVESWKQLVRITNGRYTTPVVSDHNAISAVIALDAPKKKSLGPETPTTTLDGVGAPLG